MGRFSVRLLLLFLGAQLVMFLFSVGLSTATAGGSCPFSSRDNHHHDHNHDHSHMHMHHSDSDCDHHHDHDHDHGLSHQEFRLQEELAEEEDLRRYGFSYHHHDDDDNNADHDHQTSLPEKGIWLHAMGCSLLVSMASLISLIILPLIVWQGNPSKIMVDVLAAFGAGAMLGDSFLHQLPHALGGSHGDGHSHHSHQEAFHMHAHSHAGHTEHSHVHQHSHSLKELRVGLAALGGMLLFFIVEKIVRYVEEQSLHGMPLGHHHNHYKSNQFSNKENDVHDSKNEDPTSTKANLDVKTNQDMNESEEPKSDTLRKRSKQSNSTVSQMAEKESLDLSDATGEKVKKSSGSNLVIGYLNLFSDGVHNFTDGMALGSAFLLHGSVGGWSRTLFLLAHELPQEVGDFGILVSSGFNVFTALFFNFLSALVALAGTALALIIGSDPGHSSWIEGFTAGGFIYIAMVGVLPEMHQKQTSLKTTLVQLISLMSGMGIALCISLLE